MSASTGPQHLRLEVAFEQSGETHHTHPDHGKETWRRVYNLGSGAFGTVWKEECVAGSDHKLNTLRAVKQSPRSQRNAWQRELMALQRFSQHTEHFVQFIAWFECPENLYIAMEFIPYGTLQAHIVRRPLPEQQTVLVVTQIAQALQYMHKVNFIHRDLKPLNILVNKPGPDWHVKVADFGISKDIAGGAASTVANVGTLSYMAPEILLTRNGRYTPAVDIWSLGACAFCLLTKNPPFPNIPDILDFANQNAPFPTQPLRRCSFESVEFIRATMKPERDARPTIDQVLSHAWLNVESEGEAESGEEESWDASNRWTNTYDSPLTQHDSGVGVPTLKALSPKPSSQGSAEQGTISRKPVIRTTTHPTERKTVTSVENVAKDAGSNDDGGEQRHLELRQRMARLSGGQEIFNMFGLGSATTRTPSPLPPRTANTPELPSLVPEFTGFKKNSTASRQPSETQNPPAQRPILAPPLKRPILSPPTHQPILESPPLPPALPAPLLSRPIASPKHEVPEAQETKAIRQPAKPIVSSTPSIANDVVIHTDWNVYCEECRLFITYGKFYHCDICLEGDYDVCTDCVTSKLCSRGHQLFSRFISDECVTEPAGQSRELQQAPKPSKPHRKAFSDTTLLHKETRITCDECKQHIIDDFFYHCTACLNGDYDVCRKCAGQKRECDHRLMRRMAEGNAVFELGPELPQDNSADTTDALLDSPNLPSLTGDLADNDSVHAYALQSGWATDQYYQKPPVYVSLDDALVVLDASDHKRWLVRVQKNALVGYLTAGHIETAAARFLRLSEERNVACAMTPKEEDAMSVGVENKKNDGVAGVGNAGKTSAPNGWKFTDAGWTKTAAASSGVEHKPDQIIHQKTAPQQAATKGSSRSPERVLRIWTDRSGTFKTEAEFMRVNTDTDKAHLHKANGVKIAVPMVTLSMQDLEYMEHRTGMNLEKYKNGIQGIWTRTGADPFINLQCAKQNPSLPGTTQKKVTAGEMSRPRPSRTALRTWTDRSGTFKTEAEFIEFKQSTVSLLKSNGVKIAVPIQKLSVRDLEFVEHASQVNMYACKELAGRLSQVDKSDPFTSNGERSQISNEQAQKPQLNHAAFRTWTDRSDLETQHIWAQFMGVDNGRVYLSERSGEDQLKIPINRLADKDIEFVERITGTNLQKYRTLGPVRDKRSIQFSDGIGGTALFDYEVDEMEFKPRTKEGQIALRIGERITNINPAYEKWWKGTNSKGERGFFPADRIKLDSVGPTNAPSAPKQLEPPPKQQGDILEAIANWDYEKREDVEIGFKEFERITHIEKVDDDWWLGRNSQGETGLFPANHVEVCEPAAAAARKPTAIAEFDFEAGEHNEISFPEGAKITNIEFPDEDWWHGEYDGRLGLFPSNYVKLDA